MDTGREYTEWWHHQMQIRDAAGADPLLLEHRWLEPLLDFSIRVLPHTYEHVDAPDGTSIVWSAAAKPPLSYQWTLTKQAGKWHLYKGAQTNPTAEVTITTDTAWRLFYNALTIDEARRRITVQGDPSLIEPLFTARSVMV